MSYIFKVESSVDKAYKNYTDRLSDSIKVSIAGKQMKHHQY